MDNQLYAEIDRLKAEVKRLTDRHEMDQERVRKAYAAVLQNADEEDRLKAEIERLRECVRPLWDGESAPVFGQWMRGTHASETNPQRDGMYVKTIRRRHGVINPGKAYQLTDGKGGFWEYPVGSVCPITRPLEAPDA